MDRLQKKCFIGSAGLHALLVLVLLVGPAFLAPKSPPAEEVRLLTFIPIETTDLKLQGGGNPDVRSAPPAPPAPPQQQPAPPAPPVEPVRQPEPVKSREPDPPKVEVKPVKAEDDSFDVSKSKKPKLPEVSLKEVVRKPDPKAAAQARAEAQAREEARQARAAAARRLRAAQAIGNALEHIGGNGLSGGTSIELQGPGGGGVPYANFLDAVLSAYDRAWIVPDGVTDDEATAQATVVIARDGTVVSARINEPSHNAAVDRSVRAALDKVKSVPPLPKTAKEDERTVKINFNVKAKRLLG